MPPTDFISVVDMNMGSQKADFGVYRSIDYHVQLLANGSGVANLTIAYDNTCFWDYKLFQTVLVPPGAELVNATTSAQDFNGPLSTGGANFTAFSTSVRVPANETGTITYLYTLPHVVGSSGVEERYDLYVQKKRESTSIRSTQWCSSPTGHGSSRLRTPKRIRRRRGTYTWRWCTGKAGAVL